MRHTGIQLGTVLLVLAMVLGPVVGEVSEKKIRIEPPALPPVIEKAIREAFPRGEILLIEKEVEGEDPGQYDIEIRSEGGVYEVEISPAGVVIEAKQISQVSGRDDKGPTQAAEQDIQWTDAFHVTERHFSSTGRNRFFILEPGYQIVLEGKSEKVIITVLSETVKIGGVLTRVVEEREFEDGQLIEVSRNFFAVCRATSDVFYFGEEVDDYEDGKVVGHGGAWRADKEGCKPGILMPGTVLLGARHYQEIAPNALDRAEVIADDVTMKTPAGTFRNCIRVKETSPLEPGDVCFKTYAPGIGLIQDEDLLLTAHSNGPKNPTALRDLPRAVRKTLKKYVGGGQITENEKEETDKGVVYEIEVTANGKERDILISASGQYLGTEAEQEEENDR